VIAFTMGNDEYPAEGIKTVKVRLILGGPPDRSGNPTLVSGQWHQLIHYATESRPVLNIKASNETGQLMDCPGTSTPWCYWYHDPRCVGTPPELDDPEQQTKGVVIEYVHRASRSIVPITVYYPHAVPATAMIAVATEPPAPALREAFLLSKYVEQAYEVAGPAPASPTYSPKKHEAGPTCHLHDGCWDHEDYHTKENLRINFYKYR